MSTAVGRADPGELGPVELDLFASRYLRHDQRATDSAQREAVGFGEVINMIGRDHRARAGHVLHHEFRITGNMFTEEARVGARPLIVIVAGLITDDDAYRLALVEISLREYPFKVQRVQKFKS